MLKRTGTTVGLAVLSLAAASRAVAQDQPQQPLTEHRETMESAVATPAEDLNLKQIQIPEVLVRAQANPYDMRTMDACDAVAAEVARLDAAIGADRDEPPTPDTRTTDEKRDSTAASALKLGIEAVTPYRGIIRWATGADAHARQVQNAIEAGFARRGFLKGMAVKMNCAPPASPAWFQPAPAQPAARTYARAPAQQTYPQESYPQAYSRQAYPRQSYRQVYPGHGYADEDDDDRDAGYDAYGRRAYGYPSYRGDDGYYGR